ncbi:hypothetical protein [Neobacillus sp. PS3-40]|uniref:hypothetical protein n=1 Tax=Neobacillus sp. PS3-40 TaxID=3070679 RepID=UPI0027DEBDFD|nr:hypothetical protein [Neobacillus sp. PS3-40]WML44151.1 hypothetical protein RCG20_20620 [Neobacillus sp. PS3-40]
MVRNKFFIGMILILLMSGVVGKPAFAADKNFLNEKETILPTNEKVDNVIVLGHDIDIKGKVDISAIVINGNLKISKTARIDGIVLVINGNVQQEPGSFVKENILALKFEDDTLNHLLIGAALLLGTWLIRFVLSVAVILLSILIGQLLKNKGKQSLNRIKGQTGKMILAGVIASFVFAGIILLLVITVIGIPIAIILAIPPLLFFLIGLAMISRMIGENLLAKLNPANWVINLTGAFVLVSIFNFPFFGWIVLLSVFWLSCGLMIMWMRDRWIKKRK